MSTDILQFFTEQWNINGRPVQLYSSDKKSIYKACNNGGNTLFIKIFLIDSTDIQKKNRLFSETDLMRSLSSKGYPTCKPVASKNNKFIETFQYGKNIFLCMLLSEVPGETIDINNKTAANKEFFRKLGIAVGKLHSLTKKLIHDDFLFPDYEKEFYFKFVSYSIPEELFFLTGKLNEAYDFLKGLPKDKDSYGIVHGALHFKNFFLFNGIIYIIDFDECHYNWFVFDIAYLQYIFLFGQKTKVSLEESLEFFLYPFLEGYRQENEIGQYWLDKIPAFLGVVDLIAFISRLKTLLPIVNK